MKISGRRFSAGAIQPTADTTLPNHLAPSLELIRGGRDARPRSLQRSDSARICPDDFLKAQEFRAVLFSTTRREEREFAGAGKALLQPLNPRRTREHDAESRESSDLRGSAAAPVKPAVESFRVHHLAVRSVPPAACRIARARLWDTLLSDTSYHTKSRPPSSPFFRKASKNSYGLPRRRPRRQNALTGVRHPRPHGETASLVCGHELGRPSDCGCPAALSPKISLRGPSGGAKSRRGRLDRGKRALWTKFFRAATLGSS
jgi:hypothetical protein